jgi:aspartyl/asparaginyl beta-hydroxylase (cupin superfamily)
LDDYTPVRRLGEGRTLLKDSKQEAFVLALEHTFSEETQLREYTARSKSSLSVCHQFYLNAFDYEIIEHSTICSRQYKLIEFFDYEPHSLKT